MSITVLLIKNYSKGLKSIDCIQIEKFRLLATSKKSTCRHSQKIAEKRLYGENNKFFTGNFLYILHILKKCFSEFYIVSHCQTSEMYVYPYFLLLTELWYEAKLTTAERVKVIHTRVSYVYSL